MKEISNELNSALFTEKNHGLFGDVDNRLDCNERGKTCMYDLEEYYEKSKRSIKWSYVIVFLILSFSMYRIRENEDLIVLLGFLLVILETILFISHLKTIEELKKVKERKIIEKENEEKRIRRALRKSKMDAKDD